MEKQSLSKEERLTRKKIIDQIFISGKSIKSYPLILLWKKEELPTDYPAQVVISVPKKRIKKASSRNKIKRKIREAYRKHKYLLYNPLQKDATQCAIFIIFNGDDSESYKEIEKKIIYLLNRLAKDALNKE